MKILSLFLGTYFPSFIAASYCHVTHFWQMRDRELRRALRNSASLHDEGKVHLSFPSFTPALLGSVVLTLWPGEIRLKNAVKWRWQRRRIERACFSVRLQNYTRNLHTINVVFYALELNTTYGFPLKSRDLMNIYVPKPLFTSMIISLL